MSLVMAAASMLITGSPAFALEKITVVKTADNAVINAGETASFTIVTTAPQFQVDGVTLTDQLPAGITWAVSGPDSSFCTISASNQLICSFGQLQAGESRTVKVSGPTTQANCGTLTNTAVVDSPEVFNETPDEQLNNTSTASMTVKCVPPPPPPGKTFTIGPSSMEGRILITPGDFVSGGYSFKFKQSTHLATTFTITASVAIPVTCVGGGGGTITVDLGTRSYTVPAGNTNWLPTGDQNSILSWMGSAVAPDLCGGQDMENKPGATFTATVSQSPASGSLVDFRFKYRDPAAKGKPNTDCTVPGVNRDKADVCGASWSQTVLDP